MEPKKLNDGTEVTIPLRNLVTIVVAVVLATSAYFSTQSRIQAIEQEMAKTAIVRFEAWTERLTRLEQTVEKDKESAE